jgi:hypothetical protein
LIDADAAASNNGRVKRRRLRLDRLPAPVALLVLALAIAVPSAVARTAATVEVSLVRDGGRIVVRPTNVDAADGDTLKFCNRSDVVTSLFSASRYNKFGGGAGGVPGSGVKVGKGECRTITLHNPTSAPVKVAIFSEIQSMLKLTVNVAPCGAPRTTQSAGAKCKRPAGTFVLASTKVTNTNKRELKIDAAGGTAHLDHCCDAGAWKSDYTWKVPTTLTAGKSYSITLHIKLYDMKPEQPNSDQMSALAPDFRQDLPVQYPSKPSATKTYKVPLSAGLAGFPTVDVYVTFPNGEIKYTYKNAGA